MLIIVPTRFDPDLRLHKAMVPKRTYYGRKSSKEFGDRLRGWRKNVGLTLHEAAVRLGLKCKSPEAYLSQIEKGKRPIPENLLINVATVYAIPAEEVIREAYRPQLALPLLEAATSPTALPKPVEDYIQELEEKEKEELARYASFLLLRRTLTRSDEREPS